MRDAVSSGTVECVYAFLACNSFITFLLMVVLYPTCGILVSYCGRIDVVAAGFFCGDLSVTEPWKFLPRRLGGFDCNSRTICLTFFSASDSF